MKEKIKMLYDKEALKEQYKEEAIKRIKYRLIFLIYQLATY